MNLKIVFLSACFLTGCATTATECDPSDADASLLTKLSCDTSGGYRKNITANEQQLQRNQEIKPSRTSDIDGYRDPEAKIRSNAFSGKSRSPEPERFCWIAGW